MTIRNAVTYSVFSEGYQCRVEQTTRIERPYRLTRQGAQRLIRRDQPDAEVSRVESVIHQ